MDSQKFASNPLPLCSPTFRVEESLEAIRECLERGWPGAGFKTLEFEALWRDYTDLPFAHFVNSCTAALHTAVAMLKEHHKWWKGDEIILPINTFISTARAATNENMTPVFADVDEYLCLDPDDVLRKITPKTRAVIFVGISGSTGRLEAVQSICREHGLKLILDAAHLAGSKLHGIDAGHFADVSCYSFHATKNLPTCDAGMVCFADATLDSSARSFTWLGISASTYSRVTEEGYQWSYELEEKGYKYHGNSISAALAIVALRYLDEDNKVRRALSEEYETRLCDEPRIGLIPQPADCVSSRHLFQIKIEQRDSLILKLRDHHIQAGVHYAPLNTFKEFRSSQANCPTAEGNFQMLLTLPLHLRMNSECVARVCDLVVDHAKNL